MTIAIQEIPSEYLLPRGFIGAPSHHTAYMTKQWFPDSPDVFTGL